MKVSIWQKSLLSSILIIGIVLMLSACSKANGVGINDDTGSTVGSIKVSLTAAQIKTLSSVPVDSGIPLPGIGKAIFVTSAAINYTYNSTIFDGFSQLELGNFDRTGAQYIWNGLDSQNVFSPMIPSDASGNPIAANTLLYISNNGDSVAGDGTMDIYINYIIISL
jgi:hypothetical protein